MRRVFADRGAPGTGAARVLRTAPQVMLGVSAALAAATVALGLAGSGGTDLVVFLTVAVLGLVFGVTGALVASRLPGNVIGWIFCVLALLFESSGLADAYIAYGDGAGASLPGRVWFAWTSQWFLNVSSPALIILCFLLFPSGTLPSPRWRPLVWVVAGVAAVYAASAALAPGDLPDYPFENPVGVESATALRALAEGSLLILVVPLMFFSAVSLFVRLRRSVGVERQQLKWFAYAAALLAIDLVVVNLIDALLGRVIDAEAAELVPFLVFLVALSGMPVAMGIAILRYRLYDIDILINRTLVYLTLTVSLALVYVGGVVSLQYVFRGVTGGDSQLAVVASTLTIAALFSPLRRRIQGFIDRRFYRSKYDATRTLESFGARLREETDLDRLGADLVSVVRETVQPAHVSLWLRPARVTGVRDREAGARG
jgi:hypothetical protein